jgi:hypothetical protein
MDQLTESVAPEPTGKYWLVVEFDAPASLTINSVSDQIIRQVWELIDDADIKDVDEHDHVKEIATCYRFKFMGFPEFSTMRYNDHILLMHVSPWNNWFTNMLNHDPAFVFKFNNMVGLERLKALPFPDVTHRFTPLTSYVRSNEKKEVMNPADLFNMPPWLISCTYGEMLVDEGKPEEAMSSLDTAIELNPEAARAYFARGYARRLISDWGGAVADFSVVIRSAPTVEAFRLRGDCRDELGDLYGGIADYTLALELDPNEFVALHNRAYVKRKLGDFAGAIQDYNQAIQLRPEDANAYLNRGIAKLDNRDPLGAIGDWQRVIQLDPSNLSAKQNIENVRVLIAKLEAAGIRLR